MQKNTVLEYFGTVTETAKALGISDVAVSKWNETIPKGRAYQIEVLTGGQLKADPAAPSARPAQ
ncbi:Cro/CI family transcriptional regulator [Aeromonas eucrenophila]|uniref:Cro/CI family transcriptional regulator n=1 Tax=Aeromonas eucrenophila TaxID=649 RepID=A0ABW0YBA6_9GAMM|nr:Cro/CI family transcriptional regulator [Aeromonas eucrenophila]